MCGLCGMAGPALRLWDLKTFRELLYVTNLRGGDGTGVARIGFGRDGVRLKKMVYDASYFIGMDANSKSPIINSSGAAIYLGHCRSATVGKVTESNCHPFEVGSIVGAHNGTLIEKKYTSDPKRTDSEMMFTKMAETSIPSVLRDLYRSSAYAITAYDKRDGKLYLGRNRERPLFVAFIANRDVIFWASELDALRLIMTRNDEPVEKYYKLEADSLYSIRPGRISSKKVFENWDVEDVSYRPPKSVGEWETLIEKINKEEEEKKSESKVTTHGPAEISSHDIPDFLRNPVSNSVVSELDICGRCRRPLKENEAYTCVECKSKAYLGLSGGQELLY